MSAVSFLGALCTPAALAPLGLGPLLGLFLAALGGSALHCAPMCGPFVLGQVSGRMARLPAGRLCEARRISGAMLLPYHLGRLITYGFLGGLAGAIGAGLGGVRWLGLISGLLLAVAALLFAAHAARRLWPAAARWLPGLDPAPPGLARGIAGLARHARGSGLVLGLLLGFLPCGLLYAALTAAAAGQSMLGGVVAMLVFGLGTVPALVGVGFIGEGLWRRSGGMLLPRLSSLVLVANALVLSVLAWQRFTT